MATLDTLTRRVQSWAGAPVDGDWGPMTARAVLAKAGLSDDPSPGTLGARLVEPAWLGVARSLIGTAEIKGPRHNPTILGWINALGGWFTDDETPWCGTFVGECLREAWTGPLPQHWYRALAWAEWGAPTTPQVGAVAVFGRTGGGHVGFLVGESATSFYVLGGNQGDRVSIAPIAKARLVACRWPPGTTLTSLKLAPMSGGAVSRNEA